MAPGADMVSFSERVGTRSGSECEFDSSVVVVKGSWDKKVAGESVSFRASRVRELQSTKKKEKLVFFPWWFLTVS